MEFVKEEKSDEDIQKFIKNLTKEDGRKRKHSRKRKNSRRKHIKH